MATHANARRGPGAAVIFGKNIAAQNNPLTPKIKLSCRAITLRRRYANAIERGQDTAASALRAAVDAALNDGCGP